MNYFILIITIILSFVVNSISFFEGEDCVEIKSGGLIPGKCSKIEKCEYAKQLLKDKKSPTNCGFNKNDPLVCCPISQLRQMSVSKTIAEEKCEEYNSIAHAKKGVAHGEKALPKEFPHMAAIGFGSRNKIVWYCGGSLISDYFILTAAHCVKKSLNPKWVRLGDLDLKTTNDDATPEDFGISKIHIHPEYKYPSHYNDIALIKLNKTMRFSLYVRPACLHIKSDLPTNQLQATGWGKTDFLGETSSHLMKVTMNVIDNKTCRKSYKNIPERKLKNGIVDKLQICAGDDTGKDTCPGDSGGPLHYLLPGNSLILKRYVIAGITSFGKGCGLGISPGVYTRVSSYVSWIESIVWSSNIQYNM